MSKLYLIPTPIGNLEDITLRSLRILKEADLVLAEDTRVTKRLFKHFDITTKLYSFHMKNEHKTVSKWIQELIEGKNIAVVSDAGTPAISDPGFLLVREAIKSDITIDCLPGPTAFIPALVNSGISCERFIFEGFLPTKKGRKKKLEILSVEKRTIILYESPHRIRKTLKQICDYFGEERLISVSREISKLYEETIRGNTKYVFQHFETIKPRGEFVIIISGIR